jgi:uncharacterized membrane protein
MKARFIKTILLSAVSAMAAFSAVTYSSCSPDKCKSIVCAYGGVCNDGTCYCLSGFEGTRCEAITRDKFDGVWDVAEKGTITGISSYTASIQPDNSSTDAADVLIYNFYNSFTSPIRASVKGDTLYITPLQVVDNKTITSGVGYLTPENTLYSQRAQMTLYYSVTDNTNGKVNDFGVVNGSPSIWNK